MVLGIRLPRVFKRNPKIVAVLNETEKLANIELNGLEDITKLLKGTYLKLVDQAKKGEIQFQLDKDYADVEKVKVILPYLKKIHRLLNSVRRIIEKMRGFNLKMLQNFRELNQLLVDENNRTLNRILVAKNRPLVQFQQNSKKIIEQREKINILLGKILSDLQNMVKTLERGMEDVSAFDDREIIQVLQEIKKFFAQSVQEEAQILGITEKSLGEIMTLENLSQMICGKEFFNEARRARKIVIWDNRCNAMAKTYIAFYSALQIVTPALIGGIQLDPNMSIRVSQPGIHMELKQDMQNVYFKSADNYLISGTLIKNKTHVSTKKAIIFVHGGTANSTLLEPYIKFLLNRTQGIDFLAINLRNFGPDTPTGIARYYKTTTMGLQESYDVIGAINYLTGIGYNEVIVYGYSLGGAAVLNAVGKLQDLISKNIKIKGVIVEKTFASADEFYKNLYFRFASNIGVEASKAFVGKEYSKNTYAAPSEFQWGLAKAIMQKVNGCKLENNNPAESAKKINAPILAIGTMGGDIFMKPEYMETIASSAQHGTALIVESEYKDDTLGKKHNPEFENPRVLDVMTSFVQQVL